MALKSIEITNYKAFKSGTFQLSPISVLMGSNSSGKSSLLKLILLLSQTAASSKQKKHAILTLGKLTDLGEVENLFHKKDTRKKIGIKFNVEEPISFDNYRRILLRQLSINLSEVMRGHFDLLSQLEFYYGDAKSRNLISGQTRYITNSLYNKRGLDINQIKDYVNGEFKSLLIKTRRRISQLLKLVPDKDEILEIDEIQIYKMYSLQEILDYIYILKQLSLYKNIDSVMCKFTYVRDKIIIKDIILYSEKKVIFKMNLWNERVNKKTFNIECDSISEEILKKYYSSFNKYFEIDYLRPCWNGNAIRFNRNNEMLPNFEVQYLFISLLSSVLDKSIRTFNPGKIRHVSPIRAYPRRYYFVDGKEEDYTTNTSEHNYLISYLKDKKSKELSEINFWLKEFGIEISSEEFKEIVHSIKIKQGEIKLDLLDVGFGISQVLPVIIQSLTAKEDSIVVIEQPEIHIHPKMQSKLADFFIHLSKDKNRKFIIETHSEAFLKRLRRRMAESKDNLDTSISPDDVAIHFVEKNIEDSSSVIRNVTISNSGSFQWPKDFTDNDLEDTIEFMKYQE